MFVNSDFSDLLRLFNANEVKYLVIGGYALIQHAEPRFTKDLDLWISKDSGNAAAVYKSLREFGAPLTGLTAADFSEEGYLYQMGAPPVRVDILIVPGRRRLNSTTSPASQPFAIPTPNGSATRICSRKPA
jgi:hypothetical protein